MDAETANRLIDFFHLPGRYSAFLVGGGGWDWRRVPDPQWQAFYRRFDAYSPWIVGNRLIDKPGVSHAGVQRWADDLHECNDHGMLWIPVVYPASVGTTSRATPRRDFDFAPRRTFPVGAVRHSGEAQDGLCLRGHVRRGRRRHGDLQAGQHPPLTGR